MRHSSFISVLVCNESVPIDLRQYGCTNEGRYINVHSNETIDFTFVWMVAANRQVSFCWQNLSAGKHCLLVCILQLIYDSYVNRFLSSLEHLFLVALPLKIGAPCLLTMVSVRFLVCLWQAPLRPLDHSRAQTDMKMPPPSFGLKHQVDFNITLSQSLCLPISICRSPYLSLYLSIYLLLYLCIYHSNSI